MARRVTLGNGNILVGIDSRGQVRDFYFPHVGHQNHVSGASGSFVHRIGVSVNGAFRWFDDASWQIAVGEDLHLAIGDVYAKNTELNIAIRSKDAVHNEKNVFLRSFTIENLSPEKQEVKIFFSQQFRISESRRGDTAFFEPHSNTIIHYKGHTNFLINARIGETPFEEYSVGLFDIEGQRGTYLDAEDGKLEGNPIEHGSVDSVIGMRAMIPAHGSTLAHYWITCGASLEEVKELNELTIRETPDALITSTNNFWNAWLDMDTIDNGMFSSKIEQLYRRSLCVMRVHADNGGGIIASSDTDMLHHGRDTYSYVWPRDGAFIAHAFDQAGYHDVAKRFFTFMCSRIEKGGYLLHKYRVDGCLGSSWHPWIRNGVPQLPIQEDETASIVLMLWEHYHLTHDLEFIESLYNSFIEPAAEFMTSYMEPSLGLPASSYDLWEERFSISTYTASSVAAALHAVAQCATLLGKGERARTYESVAQQICEQVRNKLFDTNLSMFVKSLHLDQNGDEVFDTTLDMSSFYGPMYFGVVAADDPHMKIAAATVRAALTVSDHEGYVRYTGDTYYARQDAASPNPWVITTLWMAEYYIRTAKNKSELAHALSLIEWVGEKSSPSGMLAEQMHPDTGEHLSTSPLIWSHAQFVTTVRNYAKRYAEFTQTGRRKKVVKGKES